MSPTSAADTAAGHGGKSFFGDQLLSFDVTSAGGNHLQEYQGNGGYMMWKRKRQEGLVSSSGRRSEMLSAKIQKVSAQARAVNQSEMETNRLDTPNNKKKAHSRGTSRTKIQLAGRTEGKVPSVDVNRTPEPWFVKGKNGDMPP